MPRLSLHLVTLLLVMTWLSAVAAAPTPAQRCEADVELVSAKFAQCRLTAEARYSKTGDADKRTAALARCSEKLQQSFAKAVARYGLNCTNVPVAEFDAYLKHCSDDAAAAAAGTALPDYVGDLAMCTADLTTCDGSLTTCAGDLATCSGGLASCTTDLATAQSDAATCAGDLTTCTGNLGACVTDLADVESDLATCEGDLAACEAQPPGTARLLKTGQTTSYGAGTDGDLQIGIAQGYVDNGDGTITDTKTALMWEKKSDDGSIHDKDDHYTWSGDSYNAANVMDGTVATTFLATLNAGSGFAGYTDWRLPNITELESIRILTYNPAVSAAFNTGCTPGCSVTTCSCTFDAHYWSSSTSVLNGQAAWGVSFYEGVTFTYPKEWLLFVRAVRGGS